MNVVAIARLSNLNMATPTANQNSIFFRDKLLRFDFNFIRRTLQDVANSSSNTLLLNYPKSIIETTRIEE